jgi:DNA-binding GntR family transcriptional regulator
MRRRIASGELAIGQSVGDLFRLEKEYDASFGTIRAAEEILVKEGLLSEIRQGIPTRVIAKPAPPGRKEVLAKLRAAYTALGEAITLMDRAPG